jgi:nucleotide-binding universal stress UspA family protein
MSESETGEARAAKRADRVFLVVVDESEEMQNALRYACRRAQRTQGRVALLDVIEPAEFQHWLGVGRVMEAEARAAAEQRTQALAAKVFQQTGVLPVVHIRVGKRAEELTALVKEDPTISTVVLGTAAGASSPGPLVTYLMTHLGRKLTVPLTLIPGELSVEDIDALT